MARKKSTAQTSEEAQASVEVQEAQASEAVATKSESADESTQTPAEEASKKASGYVVTWKAQAGKTVKGLNGVLMSFDSEGKATVDAVNAKRLLKIKGVEIAEG